MSKDIIVLTPNGRRQKVHCKADTSVLQILEDVCNKQGFQPSEYDLKHHNHILDLTTTVRFANLPNKATLEMVEAEKKRQESDVTIGLLLEDGERRTADFSPNISLYELITSLAATELSSLQQPTILYMRQEVTGISALKEKTLRQLGLIGGRAILRLLNKAEEMKQANVSAVYNRPISENINKEKTQKNNADNKVQNKDAEDNSMPGPSNIHNNDCKSCNPIQFIKKQKSIPNNETCESNSVKEDIEDLSISNKKIKITEEGSVNLKDSVSSTSFAKEKDLERRLRIEEEVTFIGAHKAIAFMQPDGMEDELEDLPDDFYELTIEEVRRLYHDLQSHRLQLENTPLLTTAKKEEIDNQTSQQKLNTYKNVVVRIQFPDHMILQGIFTPSDTIEDVTRFVKDNLQNPDVPFHIFTTPLKETLDPKTTLLEARLVPCVHMHFKWIKGNVGQSYLKEEIYTKQTSSDAAQILASKYRAPCRRKADGESSNLRKASGTSDKNKVPKWFKT